MNDYWQNDGYIDQSAMQWWQQGGQYQQEQDMGRMAKDSSGDFQQAPIGNHVARCFRIVDLGTHTGEYQGQTKTRNQVLISWELCNEHMSTGEPFIVSEFYTNTLSEMGKLRPHLESWRGRAFTQEELNGFDLQKIIGTACMLSVIHNDKNRARVTSIAAMPKGPDGKMLKAPPMHNPQFSFWLDEFDQETFDAIPEGIQKIVADSDEYKALKNGKKPPKDDPTSGIRDMGDDIPF